MRPIAILKAIAGTVALVTISLACSVAPLTTPSNIQSKAELSPTRIVTTASSVTVAWDAVTQRAASYRLYIRPYGVAVAPWRLIAEVSAVAPLEYILQLSQFGPGQYIFAVTAVGSHGSVSAKHTSLDSTSGLAGGWYLDWQ